MSFLQRVDKKEIKLKGIKDIVVVGDIGCTGFADEAKKIFASILRVKTDLFFLVGDLVFMGKKEEFEGFISFCGQHSSAPIYALPGNHDLPEYYQSLGLSTYSLILDRVACVLLDNANVHFLEDDLIFLKNQLEKHQDKKFIIIFHIPPPVDFNHSCMGLAEWLRLRAVLDAHKEKILYLISGHIHGFYEYFLDGYRILISAGGGGALIHHLPDERFKIHNFLRLAFKSDGSVDAKINKADDIFRKEKTKGFVERVPSDLKLISGSVESIMEKIKQLPLNDEQLHDIKLSLVEALVNAMKHGNKLNFSLYVEVSVETDDNSLGITVVDEGEGFDLQALADPTKPENLTKLSGRGILLIRKNMDKVEFLNSGRKIKMIKFFQERREDEHKRRT